MRISDWSSDVCSSDLPAFGWTLTGTPATRDISCTYCRNSLAPSAQLRPKLSGCAWRTEFQKASAVCPDSVRPEASVMVPEIITGRLKPQASKCLRIAEIAALQVSV